MGRVLSERAVDEIRDFVAHRAGPVETEEGRRVQRCLRCDRLLRASSDPAWSGEYPVGDKIVAGDRCPGLIE